MRNIAVFASGNGTNAENIIKYFKNSPIAKVVLIVCNNIEAAIIEKSKKHQIPTLIVNNESLSKPDDLLEKLEKDSIDLIVLAGFLKKLPAALIERYPERIINIHPALLPKFGGKGMYGMKVHDAVKNAGEKISGITVHYVNEHYDEGNIIEQINIDLHENDQASDIFHKVQKLEHTYYPRIIENLIKEL